jgi:NAD-specific glutamate dehydrogenase
VYISIKCVLSEYQIQELHNLLRQVFEDLVQVVEDWASMKLLTHVLAHSAFEVQSFLKWAEE